MSDVSCIPVNFPLHFVKGSGVSELDLFLKRIRYDFILTSSSYDSILVIDLFLHLLFVGYKKRSMHYITHDDSCKNVD